MAWDQAFSIAAFDPLHFNPVEFDELVLIHGNSGEWRRGQLCPCLRIETRRPNAGCEVCQGIGFVYPLEQRCSTCFLDHSRSTSAKADGPGYLADGTISFTLGLGLVPARGDLLLPDDDIHVVHEVFHRDTAQVTNHAALSRRLRDDEVERTEAPPNAVFRSLAAGPARLLYPTVTELEAVHWLEPEPGRVGGLRLARATEGHDYVLTDGSIRWLADAGPNRGRGFTVRYRAPAAYIVHGTAPMFRHESGHTMPWNGQASRLDHLQRRADLW